MPPWPAWARRGLRSSGCGDDDDDDQQAAPAVAQQAQAEQQAQQQAQQAAQQEQAAEQQQEQAAEQQREQAEQQATAQVTPKSGGTINNDASSAQQPHFDIHRASTAGLSGWGAGPSYNGLLKPQAFGHGGATIVEGDLAQGLPEVVDGTTLIFSLRPGVKWFDIPPVNGRTLVANDVDFGMKRQLAEGVNASDLAGIAKQEVVDDLTISLTLADVNVDFLAALTDARNSIVTPEAVEAGGGDLEGGPPIGTGAWIFDEWTRDVSYRTRRNPDYFGGPTLPYADNMENFFIKDAARSQSAFLAGELVSLSAAVLEEGVLADVRDDPKFRVAATALRANSMILVRIDGTFPYLLDPRVRQALSISVDRDVIIKNVLRDIGVWDATGMTLVGPDWRLPQEELREVMAFDPQKAQELLDAAGADGNELPSNPEVPIYSLSAGTIRHRRDHPTVLAGHRLRLHDPPHRQRGTGAAVHAGRRHLPGHAHAHSAQQHHDRRLHRLDQDRWLPERRAHQRRQLGPADRCAEGGVRRDQAARTGERTATRRRRPGIAHRPHGDRRGDRRTILRAELGPAPGQRVAGPLRTRLARRLGAPAALHLANPAPWGRVRAL